MTTELPEPRQDNFDTGPLSWVIGEIREALAKSKTALFDAVAQDAESQSTLLRHAKTYLHQAHGALEIVDVDGVAIMTETVEDLLDRIEAGKLVLTEKEAQAIERAYQAVVEYLDELLTGAAPQPVRLFPYYRALLEVRGAERIHPADLFFPNLAIRPQLPPPAAATPEGPAIERADYASLRQRFEKSLLSFLKNTDPIVERDHTRVMKEIIAELERRQTNSHAQAFWWVMHGFAQAVSLGHIKSELYVKQLFGRINLQIRRLVDGSPSIAERLLRDALFFIARAENPPFRVQQIRSVYQLDGLVPVDYEKKRYGQVDAAALTASKEVLTAAKNIWGRIAGGDANLAESFEHEMKLLTEASAKLNAPALSKFLGELKGIARHAVKAAPGNSLSLEIATSLLFIENSLDNINRLPEDFPERIEALTDRLLSIAAGETKQDSAQWMDDLARQEQQRQTVIALASEMKSSLRIVEKALDEYFIDPSKHAGLVQIDPVLHQIEGALAILDLNDAMRAIQHTKAAVQKFANAGDVESRDIPAEQQALRAVAQNIGALGFFVEMLSQSVEVAKGRFAFDDKLGFFRANLIERNVAAQTAQTVVVSPESPQEPANVNAGESLADSLSFPTVEAELSLHQQQSVELAASLAEQPDNEALQEQLKSTLKQVRRDAALLDNPEATDRAQAAIDMLERPDFVASQDALTSVYKAETPVSAPVILVSPPVTPATDEAVDAELLEIFMSEAEEVLAYVQQTIPESRNSSNNQEHLTTLRRSFHTLKGSGRMVGLTTFAEAASSIEQVMNLWLSEARSGTADLYALLDKASDELSAWVTELNAQEGYSRRTATALVAAAERVKLGGAFYFEESVEEIASDQIDAAVEVEETPPAIVEIDMPEAIVEAVEIDEHPLMTEIEEPVAIADIEQPQPETIEPEESLLEETLPEIEIAATNSVEEDVGVEDDAPTEVPQDEEATESEPLAVAEIIDFPSMRGDNAMAPDDNIKHIGKLEISVPLYNIYIAETDQIVRLLSQDFAEWRHEPYRHVSIQAVHAAHSLGGSSATVGFNTLQEVAHALEMVLQSLARQPVLLTDHDFDMLDRCVEQLKQMLQTFSFGEMSDHEPELVHALERMQQDLAQRPPINPYADIPVFSEGPDELDALLTEDALHDLMVESLALDAESQSAEIAPVEQMEAIAELVEPTEDELRELNVPVFAESDVAEQDAPEVSEEQAVVEAAAIDEVEAALELEDALAEEPSVPEFSVPEPVIASIMQEEELLSDDIPPVYEADTIAQLPESTAQELQESQEPSVPVFAESGLDEQEASEVSDEPDVVESQVSDELDAAPVLDEALPESSVSQPIIVSITQEEQLADDKAPVEEVEAIAELVEPIEEVLAEEASLPEFSVSQPVIVSSTPGSAVPQYGEQEAAVPDVISTLKDELDADLLPVFLEEGRDMLPQVGQALRAWQQNPSDLAPSQSLLRLLHTIKGSARMAGAMRLGQHTHEIETRIERLMSAGLVAPQSIEDLLVQHDRSLDLFDRLENPQPDQPEEAPQPVEHRAAPRDGSAPAMLQPVVKAMPMAAKALAPTPLVRVRADILDRLVNQAGEVSISRAKLENEVGTLRQSLLELTDNMTRLRSQLREVEIQAETQITSRMAQSNDREFDPLEFDRFSRLQELTRMMAESVNDVASVQDTLTRTVDGATSGLTVQARLTRDLQKDLMRVRMVPFASISDRLYSVARQTSKEVDKRVNLDIRGTSIEIDRGVLEKMAGPFEHLLRNAIVHGIETRDARRATGKQEIGELLVEIRQEGNEVVIHFKDDGRGLDIDRIRSKAKAIGLLTADAQVSDAEAADLIFEPGFSTASEVTELAGRGVGMDVVRSEAAGLGGRVAIASEPGKGAHFTIHLPLTLAVTQVVLLTTGGKTYAVPSVLVEQVQQLKSNGLAAAYNEGAVMWRGERVTMHYLSSLLGEASTAPVAQQYSPILILRSGNDRVAVHVDSVVGNREVVVKNIGPQLARMIGIAGATVLGSGDIVLILNPVPLAHKMAQENLRAPRISQPETPEGMGAVAELTSSVSSVPAAPEIPVAEPVAGLRKMKIVMVVDDSLTVRRVTQRFLLREGYQVVLAKDGVDALEQLQSITPDVMLVDIEMPRMDGFDLTRNVRSDERTSQTPIIMITSRTADKHRNYAMELGVNAYFGKPFHEANLLEAIAGFVNKEVPAS